MDAGLEAALFYDDDDEFEDEFVFEQDGPHSPLTVRRHSGRDSGSGCHAPDGPNHESKGGAP
jgi:hypothetical protein